MGFQLVREPRPHLELVVRVGEVLAGNTREAERPRLSQPVRLEARVVGDGSDPEGSADLPSQRRAERGLRLPDVPEKHPDRPRAEAEDGRAPEEVLAIELARDEFVDEVVLDRTGVVSAELLDQPLCLAIHPRVLPSVRGYGGRRFVFSREIGIDRL